MKYFLAHAGEDHSTSNETLFHNLESDWVFYLPLAILILLAVGFSLFKLSKKSLPATLIVIMFSLLIAGMLLYSLLPVVSVICLVLGFVMSLFLTINGLRK